MATVIDSPFYVYEHWRPDTDVCFYVGKGKNNRAWGFNRRNPYYKNVVAKLSRLGMCVEVRMVRSGMMEADAHALEIERIAFWRKAGIKIANATDGGEGVSGLKHSAKSRQKMKEKRSAQSREKHSAIMRGRKHSTDHRAKISAGNKGRIVSAETKRRISEALKGRGFSEQRIANLRSSHLGKTHDDATRKRMSESQRARYAKARENA